MESRKNESSQKHRACNKKNKSKNNQAPTAFLFCLHFLPQSKNGACFATNTVLEKRKTLEILDVWNLDW